MLEDWLWSDERYVLDMSYEDYASGHRWDKPNCGLGALLREHESRVIVNKRE